MGADAFGLNCSVGPRDILAQIERLRPWAEIPLLAKPNAGLPHVVDGRTEYDCPPDEFAACAREFAAAGVAFFGGCCGTDEHHIAALKSALEGVETAVSAPEYGGRIPCATEKEAFLLDPAAEIPQPFECDGALLENIEDAQDEGAELIAVRVDTLAEAEALADCQYAVTRPAGRGVRRRLSPRGRPARLPGSGHLLRPACGQRAPAAGGEIRPHNLNTDIQNRPG